MSMNNIVLTLADASTTVTLSPLVGSAGDAQPALYINKDASSPATAETLEVRAKSNGPRTARRVTAKFTRPIVDADGLVSDRLILECSAVIPQSVEFDVARDFSSMVAGILPAVDVANSLSTGYAPTN